MQDPSLTVRLVGVLEDTPDLEVHNAFRHVIGTDPLRVRRDTFGGSWLVDLDHPEHVAHSLRNGEEVPVGGVVATVCHLHDDLTDTGEVCLSMVFSKLGLGVGPQGIESILQGLRLLFSMEASLSCLCGCLPMGRCACALVLLHLHLLVFVASMCMGMIPWN